MNTLFLVHIPETACTRFKLASCRYWGSGRIVSDYGPDNKHSSLSARELVHRDNDLHSFKQFLIQQDIALYASTKPARTMSRLFPANRIITFISDPVDRLVRQYHRDVKNRVWDGPLLDYCTLRKHRNQQSRQLLNMPLELLGFVGLSDRYPESLQLLNRQFDSDITQLQRKSQTKELSNLEKTETATDADSRLENVRSDILELNQQDLALYRDARELLEARLEIEENREVWVHGRVQRLSGQKIQGWAVAPTTAEPCKVRILVNDECVAVATAQDYLSDLRERNVSRDGYVGFHHRFNRTLNKDDQVSCYIHTSQQRLRGPQRVDKN